MSNFVAFQMWGPHRQSIIDEHLFYVEQAKKRLLSQFSNIETEAKEASDSWLQQNSRYFNPDKHDVDAFYEAAFDAGSNFYQLLSDMQDMTRLSVVAGMFHEWDKKLRDWLVHEIQHWHRGDTTTKKVWLVDFGKIIDLLEQLGWKIRAQSYFPTLDALRLVVNVYKHGPGNSLEDLKQAYPEYIHDPLGSTQGISSDMDYSDYTDLKVSDDQLESFSEAIAGFWRDVPDNVLASQISDLPDWLKKAISTDVVAKAQTEKK